MEEVEEVEEEEEVEEDVAQEKNNWSSVKIGDGNGNKGSKWRSRNRA